MLGRVTKYALDLMRREYRRLREIVHSGEALDIGSAAVYQALRPTHTVWPPVRMLYGKRSLRIPRFLSPWFTIAELLMLQLVFTLSWTIVPCHGIARSRRKIDLGTTATN